MKCWPSSTANLVRHESIAPCRTQPAKRPWLVELQSVHALTELTSLVLNVKRYTVEKYTQVQLWNTQSEYKLKFYKLKFYIHILFIKDEKFGKSLYNHCIKPSCKITSESNERYMTVYECIFDLWQNTNKPSENWLTEIDF